jgi:hypothetical protein
VPCVVLVVERDPIAQLDVAVEAVDRHVVIGRTLRHGEVIKLSARYGIEALVNREAKRRTMRGFKIATAKLATPISHAGSGDNFPETWGGGPRRLPIGEIVAGDVVQLATERKHLTDVIKMVAYQVETDLVRRITPSYHRADDEARTLVQSALANAGDIAVTATELRVTFAPLCSPHRTAALAALCAELDASPRGSPARSCASATPSRPEIRTVQPTGMSGGLDSAESRRGCRAGTDRPTRHGIATAAT